MVILITGASRTGKTALAQRHEVNYILINDRYQNPATSRKISEGQKENDQGVIECIKLFC